jgi:DnaK suppressor protein
MVSENKQKIAPKALDKETIEKIKNELLAKKDQIIKDLKEMTGATNIKDDHSVRFPDYGDKKDENAQEIDEYTTSVATEKVLESSLRDIESSLDRIEKGTYGICKYCRQPIGEKRMLARPVASACVECKTKLQKGDM